MTNDRLTDLYNQVSKHSQYQLLASPLRKYISSGTITTKSRHEQERLKYLVNNAPYLDHSFADIGGNTGFFTFELLEHGAKSAIFIEGNSEHSNFVKVAADTLGWEDRVTVQNRYLDFQNDLSDIRVNLCLLLNVLHHVGDDYGDPTLSLELARNSILTSLANLASHTQTLIFQLGFNWKGDRKLPLFEKGTKAELIDFVKSGTKDFWEIQKIGIAEQLQSGIVYKDLSQENIGRQDSLGEFLNRPLFVMKSKQFE